ncbi:putative histidine kinase KdpD [Leptospira fainei serovar Hurstbridge str. BUT 6]|uniref:histidine kinase n=1 Tax=Leptospira fainei serovar Hurstbridge str. BUT 6 TaxID=1193011 RepID=S3V009_9LEPT|nr:sensor histidine kinase KdpD [Leptospira fainei]EPG74818.1 putative histidine kinase KdpD [Leptospira fainei serovar Hurstbridge str. BUT 6]
MAYPEEKRPDPDELLSRIGDKASSRGKLKIFFGMAAGVGKTFEMLRDAQKAKSEGREVVIGYLETHKREETEAQALGLEIVPRKKSKYKNVELEEMDLDAVLERKPDLVLVDELAHTNVPGSRHPKRYQDVLEILDNGIDVYSTLNVQHLESRANIVEELSGAPVAERVPDSILEIADEVELVDLVPDDLVKRLKEGKIYPAEKVPGALLSFFRIPNLTALRELSLSYTSKLVDRELARLEPTRDSKLSEKILVAISSSPASGELIRHAKRMAFLLKCSWVTVYIEDGRNLSAEDRKQLHSHLQLARELGAEILSLPEKDLVQGILRAVDRTKATHVVIGRTTRNRFWQLLEGGTLLERLTSESANFQLVVVPGGEGKYENFRPLWWVGKSGPIQYFLSFLSLLGVTSINLLTLNIIGYWSIGLVYLFFVMLISLFAGRGPVLVTSALSALLWNFLFIPPRFTFFIGKLEDWMMFVMYFVLAMVLGVFTTRLRSREDALKHGEEAISSLYELSIALSRTHTADGIVNASVELLSKTFDCPIFIVITDKDGRLERTAHPKSTFIPEAREFALASWSYQNRKPSGNSTDTVPLSRGLYLPLLSPGGCFGVLGLDREGREPLEPGEDALLHSMLNQIALAVERIQLLGLRENARMVEESERLHSALFNSVSHEFRTPLTIIRASLDLLDGTVDRSAEKEISLLAEVRSAYRKLERLVNNLLDMTRLESGRLKLDLQWEDPADLVLGAVAEEESERGSHRLTAEVDQNMPLVRLDNRIMQQVLIHLIQNAFLHTPEGTPVTVRASVPRDHLLLVVEDKGPGIPKGEEERIFDKFTKVSSYAHGTGLGLSICKGLVEAQGGRIWAENRAEGGARFLIRIPVMTFPPLEEDIG